MKCLMKSFCDGHQSSFGSIASGIARASMLENAATISVTFINYLQLLVPTFCSNFLSNASYCFSPPPPFCFGCPRKPPPPVVAMAKITRPCRCGWTTPSPSAWREPSCRNPRRCRASASPWRSLASSKKTPLDGKKLIQIPSLERSKRCRIDIQLLHNRADTYLLDV